MGHRSFKKPVYGKVKPVKAGKAEPKYQKPDVAELRSALKELSVSPQWTKGAQLQLIANWYVKMLRFLNHNPKVVFSPNDAKLILAAKAAYRREPAQEKERASDLISFIVKMERVAKTNNQKVPEIDQYMKKATQAGLEFAKKQKEIQAKWDDVLTLLMRCFPNSRVSFAVVPSIVVNGESRDSMFNQSQRTLSYSVRGIKAIKQEIRENGLLGVVVREAMVIAKAEKDEGFALDKYKELMVDFEKFCRLHQHAPKRLVNNKAAKPKPKTRKKAA